MKIRLAAFLFTLLILVGSLGLADDMLPEANATDGIDASDTDYPECWRFGGGLIKQYIRFTAEERDEYITIFQAVLAQYPDPLFLSIGERAELDRQAMEHGEVVDRAYNVDIEEGDISEENALCIAYAWLQQKYHLTNSQLQMFQVRTKLQSHVQDAKTKIWFVELHMVSDFCYEEQYAEIKYFFVYIDARTGLLIACIDPSCPVSG